MDEERPKKSIDQAFYKRIHELGIQGRIRIVNKLIQMEKELISNCPHGHLLPRLTFELASIFNNIEEALDYKFNKIQDEWDSEELNKPEQGRGD